MARMPSTLALLDAPVLAVLIETEGMVNWFVEAVEAIGAVVISKVWCADRYVLDVVGYLATPL